MPYLKMLLDEKQIDEVFISNTFLNSIIGNSIIEDEKQVMLKKHAGIINETKIKPVFCIDSVPSTINIFTPLRPAKRNE